MEPVRPDPPAAALDSMAAARAVLETLGAAGVAHLVLSPGSRSAPLAYAAAEAEAAGLLTVHVRIDERDAGFTALGLSLASGAPVAVATTSGTAVGELLPAVMEANHAAVPLILLSADRPAELHGTGANQTTDQAGLFGTHVRGAVVVPAGRDPRAPVRQSAAAALAAPRGPVQINLEFRDPLAPEPGAPMRIPVRPAPAATAARAEPSVPAPEGAERRRTVVLAGHDAGGVAARFAEAHGLPLLAEPSSNARSGPNAIGPYRLLIGTFARAAQPIERVVVFGRPTLSRPVARLLGDATVPAALYAPEPVAWFEPGRRRERVVADLGELSAFAGAAPDGWLAAWREAAAAADGVIAAELDTARAPTGPGLARAVWAAGAGPLVIGSSNAVRDADLWADPAAATAERRVFANRGLAGIDGTLATAAGISIASRERTTVLVGDVTLLHDVGGLHLGAGETEPELDVVVLNDAGGAIFSTLEHGAVEAGGAYGDAVERFFATPHAVDLSALATAYGLAYAEVRTTAELAAALAAPAGAARRVIDVKMPRGDVRGRTRRIAEAVERAIGG
ncbi:2-succinyl-5-enolpyruvyl-6-hydroxy-3-cyclohexene-1-carboxylic-acid synthase [Zhihengliuella salsuginis]|uniref:2-succinyl-5-enolpyruvyl-6-hydroxy-3-cyclohexene-1-carboxylate synthase n=1 Tax=Zhihengliuella salsuginis TaxID=578222 RepID=A0ABQ3GL49_9MICC|nr:2-succinyl-5-enolpyruvyl-6-hydroxy-3-cyclohexene-1-carboxylic-acid synthase [Zhihengliuella salsuginis]GHD10253.1 2-succinyl-5-enolpyruvyl-6-hydroxy-3-cyclohexene-1-carboxylate synthase [Zhihengliuella salsuginis]